MAENKQRVQAMLAFESRCAGFELDFHKEFNEEEGFEYYDHYETGTFFGSFLMGWDERGSYEGKGND